MAEPEKILDILAWVWLIGSLASLAVIALGHYLFGWW